MRSLTEEEVKVLKVCSVFYSSEYTLSYDQCILVVSLHKRGLLTETIVPKPTDAWWEGDRGSAYGINDLGKLAIRCFEASKNVPISIG